MNPRSRDLCARGCHNSAVQKHHYAAARGGDSLDLEALWGVTHESCALSTTLRLRLRVFC
eukprot:1636118-Amphidinium_carterae.1